MMVYGHPTSAADGAFFLQNFLSSVKPPPDETLPQFQQGVGAQFQPGVVGGGFNLGGGGVGGGVGGGGGLAGFSGFGVAFGNFGGVVGFGGAEVPAAASSASRPNIGSGGSGFLYNLLTAQDASAVQQRSAFHGGGGPAHSDAAAAPAAAASAAAASGDDFPRRSNSMGHSTMRRGSGVLLAPPSHAAAAAAAQCMRPSSVPRGLKAAAAAAAASPSASPSTTFSSEEPLDLSTMRMAHEPISDADSNMGSPHHEQQPMLRTILSQAARHYQAQVQPVQLAKKNVMVAQSHVSDWLRKGSELVQTNATLFSTLDRPAQAGLLCRAWPRILQLYMLENSFHFAVSPYSGESGACANPTARLPTKKFADDLQRLISLASGIPFDNMTYNLLRLAAIFKAESAQEMHLQEVQEEILKHVLRHLEMKGNARHFNDAVAILQAVSETDKEMLENLFCGHMGSLSVDDFIKVKLGC